MAQKVFVFLLLLCLNFKESPDAIVGIWLTPQKDSKIEIYKKNNLYFGKIHWTNGKQLKDDNNPEKKLKNRLLLGLTILSNFKFDGDETWENGKIYDPREGKTYSCKITLKNKTTLQVRGYIGISLLGRTENWTKSD